MNENEKPREDDETGKDIVFHYSREHRLSRAPAAVRAIYDENSSRASLSKKLFGSKGNVLILVSIILISLMYGISSRVGNSRRTSVTLGGNTVELSVFREGEVTGLKILKTVPKSGEFYIGALDISVSPVLQQTREGKMTEETPEVMPVFSHRFYFNPADSESFIISLPFEGDDFYVFLSTEFEQKVVRVR